MTIKIKHTADEGLLTDIAEVHHPEFPFRYIVYECDTCADIVLSLEDEDYYFA